MKLSPIFASLLAVSTLSISSIALATTSISHRFVCPLSNGGNVDSLHFMPDGFGMTVEGTGTESTMNATGDIWPDAILPVFIHHMVTGENIDQDLTHYAITDVGYDMLNGVTCTYTSSGFANLVLTFKMKNGYGNVTFTDPSSGMITISQLVGSHRPQ